MDHLRVYGTDDIAGVLHDNEDPRYQSDDLGTIPHCDDDAGTMVSLSTDPLPVHDVLSHRTTAASSGGVVSRDLRIQSPLPQSRPSFRCTRTGTLW